MRSSRLAAAGAALMSVIAVPAAHAAAGDLDPTFGAGGVARLGPDTRSAQSNPVVQADGKVVVAGYEDVSSGRLFLARFTAGGAPDPSFGTNGKVFVGESTAFRSAALAQAADGKLVLVSGQSGGKAVISRFTATGAVDTTWNSGGRVSVSLGGSVAVPTGVVAQSDGKVTFAAASDGGGSAQIAVVRVKPQSTQLLTTTPAQLDTSFDGDGIARISFGDKISGAFDLAQIGSTYVIAGGTGEADYRPSADTVLARLTASGALDTTFGTGGKVRTDVAGNGGFDVATALQADATGALAVTGYASFGRGYVARYTPTGALDTSFGTGGIFAGGLGPAGKFTVPADVKRDPAGRLLVGLTSYTTTYSDFGSRWHVARLLAGGSSPMDPDFGTGGRVDVVPCDNAGISPLTGLATPTASRIVVAGSCGGDGQVAAARLLTSPALPGTTTASATDAAEAAGRERIPLSSLDPTAVLQSAENLQSAPVRNVPVRNVPVRNVPVRNVPVRNVPVSQSVLLDPAMPPLSLATVPVRNVAWKDLLAGTPLADAPLQSVTLQQVYRLNPLPAALAALSLADLEVESTPVRNVSLTAYLLGRMTLSQLPAPANGWPSGVDPATTTFFALEQKGYDVSDYLSRPLSLKGLDLGASTIGKVRLTDYAMDRSPLGRIRTAELPAGFVTCGSSCAATLAGVQAADPTGWTTKTVGDLVARLPFASLADVSLGQVASGLLSQDDIPYERLSRQALLDAADRRDDDLQTYRIAFDADCAQIAGTSVDVALPDGARIKPGSAVAGGRTLADPTRNADGTLTFTGFSGTCTAADVGTVALTFAVEPGPVLGPRTAKVTVRNGAESQRAAIDVTVDDSRDAPATESDAPEITTGALRTGHISSAGDVDLYRFRVTEPGAVTFTLSGLDYDADLVVYGPATGVPSSPVRNVPVRNVPVRNVTVPDSANEPVGDGVLQPTGVQDAPVRNVPVRNVSVRRGTADEAATVRVTSADVGQDLYVQVSGYDGATSADPYVLRSKITAAEPALPCATRPSLQNGTPGTFPSLPLAADRQTLILVDQRRMSSRYGAAATDALVTKLKTLAARDDVRGVVVPVESDSTVDVDGAMAAWDADPCSPARANAAVAKINAVVDHVRSGLPELRSVVLVGPDDVLPQGRVPDDVTLGNETEAADDLTFDGKDNPVSRAMREGNVLSDDPYGDLDPEARRGGTLYVPDVAVGRLVETPAEIDAQVQRFLDNDGRLDPKTARTYGYDFLEDGAREVDAALRTAVPEGGASSRIDDTWSAADASGAMSGAAGFLSINAHYDQYRLLPAAAFSGAGAPNLLTAAQITPAPGSIAFTMGCHAGLNVADVLANGPDPRTSDWTQRFTSRGSLYASNTGYGYGDTDTVAYSERLMVAFARALAGKKVTAGQALMFAKQTYAGSMGISDAYDRKVLLEAAFYGLPMWRIGAAGGTGASALPSTPAPSDAVATTSRTLTPAFSDPPIRRDRGTYWTADGQPPLVVQQRPVQPRTSTDVTAADGLPAHGVLVTDLASTDVPDVDGVFSSPVIDAAATSPEDPSAGTIFPASLANLRRIADPQRGLRDVVDVAAGQFRSGPGEPVGRGTQRLFTRIGLKVLRGASDDWTPPTIRRVDTVVANGAAVFTVELNDDSGKDGLVLYRTDADATWRTVTLARATAGRMGGGVVLPAGATRITEWYAQVSDGLNVGSALNKGRGYVGTPLPTPSAGDARVTLSPAPPASGYYTASPTIGLDPGEHGGQDYEVSVDGGEFRPYTGPFTIPSATLEGGHTVTFRGEDGTPAVTAFAIDADPPTISGAPRTAPNGVGWYRDDVTIDWTCGDAASGIASCPDPSVISTEGANRSATGTATDRAGRSASATVSGINLDKSPPSATITSSGILLFGEVQGKATDALSGVDTVVVTFNGTPAKATVKNCDAARTSCDWSVKPPSSGIFTVQALVTDRVGREGQSSQGVLTIG